MFTFLFFPLQPDSVKFGSPFSFRRLCCADYGVEGGQKTLVPTYLVRVFPYAVSLRFPLEKTEGFIWVLYVHVPDERFGHMVDH